MKEIATFIGIALISLNVLVGTIWFWTWAFQFIR